jgi:hypothetical protein
VNSEKIASSIITRRNIMCEQKETGVLSWLFGGSKKQTSSSDATAAPPPPSGEPLSAVRVAIQEAERIGACLAVEKAEREAARLAAEEAEREAARVAAEEAEREAARVAAEEAEREAARVAAEEAEIEVARLAADEAEREAARVATDEAEREAARDAAEEAEREAVRVAAEEAEREAALLATAPTPASATTHHPQAPAPPPKPATSAAGNRFVSAGRSEDGQLRGMLYGMFPADLPLLPLLDSLADVMASRPDVDVTRPVKLAEKKAAKLANKHGALSGDERAAIVLYTMEAIPRETSVGTHSSLLMKTFVRRY